MPNNIQKKIILKKNEFGEYDLGKEYIDELKKILEIRLEARLIWGDSFFKEKIEDLLVMLESKIRRFKNTKNKDAQLDSLRDACNYILFILCILNKEGNKNGDDL
jgi:hypothetical protein